MRKNRTTAGVTLFLALCTFSMLAQERSWAEDDFNNIVHHIESQYHVHRNYRFLMAFAGVVVKCSSFTGVKGFRAAIFENQHLFSSEPDARVDEVIQAAGKSGWQPLIRSYSRRTGEHNYIYAQSRGKDVKLLIVNVEPNEAVVAQVKINPDKLNQFINEHSGESSHRATVSRPEDNPMADLR
ncbi:MAG TPA: hypothetical protein VKY85_26710 [Candidatus Angelobacter sp.]|nr:hypothetical protein [Candidatus Angelobacter sp.]